MARKSAIHLLWMMRRRWDYEQVKRFGPHAGQPETRRGVDEGDFEHLWPALLTLRASRKHTSALYPNAADKRTLSVFRLFPRMRSSSAASHQGVCHVGLRGLHQTYQRTADARHRVAEAVSAVCLLRLAVRAGMTIVSDGLGIRGHTVNPNVYYVNGHCYFIPFPGRAQAMGS
jgi:hypothetical protein